ncbi:MAG: hypothetical protein ACYDCJ_12195 [Gammaproteobacteria bacterium]
MFTTKQFKSLWMSDIAQALRETTFIWIASSLFPILLIWLIGALTKRMDFQGSQGFANAFGSFFFPREVFLYITTLLAPTVAFMVFHWRARKHINLYNTLFIAIFLIMILTAIIYALEKAGVGLDPSIVKPVAIIAYIFSIAIWCFVHWYQKHLPKLLEGEHKESGDSVMSAL